MSTLNELQRSIDDADEAITARINRDAAELARLRAIVAKLPVSRDGVTILPGMTVYPVGTDMGGVWSHDGTSPHVVGSVSTDHAWIHAGDATIADAWLASDLLTKPAKA
jgi:hypothetical protein